MSLTGVPSGDVVRLDGALGCSLGLAGVRAGFASGAVADEGVSAGAGFSPRSFLFLPGGVIAGLLSELTGGTGVGVASFWSLFLGCGVIAGLAGAAELTGLAPAGLATAAGDVPAAGAAGEAPAGLCAASALSRGLTFGGGTFLGSSLFIFCFRSACAFGSETPLQPCSTFGLSIFFLTIFGAIRFGAFSNLSGAATISLSPCTLVRPLDCAATLSSTLLS